MRNRNNVKKPTMGKVIIQWVITVFLIIGIYTVVGYSVSTVLEQTEYDEYKWLLSDLNEGDYAGCMEYYTLRRQQGGMNTEEYAQFAEFDRFYRQYILCVEYREAKNSEVYQHQIKDCLETMRNICENSLYELNIPHYEYLIESLTVVDEDNL